MPNADDRASANQFRDIDPLDTGLASRDGHDSDPFEDVLAFDADFFVEPLPARPIPKTEALHFRQRCKYGLGVDARRSARFRTYPIETSTIHKHLHDVYGIVTKELLQSLISALINQCPPSARPNAPTRDQRRAKGGLVAWLDDNESMALSYLRFHSAFA
jgi:hypothetical protein